MKKLLKVKACFKSLNMAGHLLGKLVKEIFVLLTQKHVLADHRISPTLPARQEASWLGTWGNQPADWCW